MVGLAFNDSTIRKKVVLMAVECERNYELLWMEGTSIVNSGLGKFHMMASFVPMTFIS